MNLGENELINRMVLVPDQMLWIGERFSGRLRTGQNITVLMGKEVTMEDSGMATLRERPEIG